jgi:mono/diheme cytochrome c family protein
MKDFFKKLPEQAVRVVIVFLVLVAGVFVIRQFIIPPEMKEPALQKASSEEREAAKEIKYAGAQVCEQCHEKEPAIKKIGYHRDLSCESCHGAAQKHVDNPTDVKPTSPKSATTVPTATNTTPPGRPVSRRLTRIRITRGSLV